MNTEQRCQWKIPVVMIVLFLVCIVSFNNPTVVMTASELLEDTGPAAPVTASADANLGSDHMDSLYNYFTNNKSDEMYQSSDHLVINSTNTIIFPEEQQPSRNHSREQELLELVPSIHVEDVDCDKLFDNDPDEIEHAVMLQRANRKTMIPDLFYKTMASNCTTYRQRYITQTLSEEEKNFPIAFSLLLYKEVEQVEKLLRAIYAPQNYYCIHVDLSAQLETRSAMTAIADCFDNVFLTETSYDVQWGEFSVLEPELQCMKELWQYQKWKYFINLTGQEYPLKTNLHLVKILKAYNGANNIDGSIKRRDIRRTKYIHIDGLTPTRILKPPPPPGTVITKGSVHITACRGFVDFILNHHKGQELLEWVKDTGIPDETFFTALNHSPQLRVPGAYTGPPEVDLTYRFLTRYKVWDYWPFDWPCKGKIVREICIFGVGDLPALGTRPELFANKFHLKFEKYAYQCMEERHFSLIKQDILGERTIDTTFYKQQLFVKNQVSLKHRTQTT